MFLQCRRELSSLVNMLFEEGALTHLFHRASTSLAQVVVSAASFQEGTLTSLFLRFFSSLRQTWEFLLLLCIWQERHVFP